MATFKKTAKKDNEYTLTIKMSTGKALCLTRLLANDPSALSEEMYDEVMRAWEEQPIDHRHLGEKLFQKEEKNG